MAKKISAKDLDKLAEKLSLAALGRSVKAIPAKEGKKAKSNALQFCAYDEGFAQGFVCGAAGLSTVAAEIGGGVPEEELIKRFMRAYMEVLTTSAISYLEEQEN